MISSAFAQGSHTTKDSNQIPHESPTTASKLNATVGLDNQTVHNNKIKTVNKPLNDHLVIKMSLLFLPTFIDDH